MRIGSYAVCRELKAIAGAIRDAERDERPDLVRNFTSAAFLIFRLEGGWAEDYWRKVCLK